MTGIRRFIRMLPVALMPLAGSCSGNTYKIVGHAPGYDGTAVLTYTDLQGSHDSDTTSVIGGDFIFHGKIDDAYSAQVLISQEEKPQIMTFLVLEPGRIEVDMEAKPDAEQYSDGTFPCRSEIRGTKNNTFISDLDEATAGHKGNDDPAGLRSAMMECIRSHNDCEYAAFLYGCYFADLPLEEFISGFESFTDEVRQSKLTANVRRIIEARTITAPGREAPDFSLKDMDGGSVSLRSFRGSYVVVDFWASWCVPCRRGVPAMKELYAEYHDKGLEIIAVSQDSDSGRWKEAVEQDGAEYIHLIDEPGGDGKARVGSAYGVSSIPAYFLIDREGRFIGKFDHDGLEEQLSTLL